MIHPVKTQLMGEDPDLSLLRSIITLKANRDFKAVVKWIADSLQVQSIETNSMTGEATIKNQGRNLELQDICDYIEGAENLYEEHNKKPIGNI